MNKKKKMTWIQRNLEILNLFEKGEKKSDLAKKYKISRPHVAYIIDRGIQHRKLAKNWGSLDVRIVNLLLRSGYKSLKEARMENTETLLSIRNIGIKAVLEIKGLKEIKNEIKSTITFDSDAALFILEALDQDGVPKSCMFCGDTITDKNFGGAMRDGMMCKNIVCLIKYVEASKS